MTVQTLDSQGELFIKGWEARGAVPVLTSYRDSKGVWTIGFGHIKDVRPAQTITPEQAEQFFRDDVLNAEMCVMASVRVPLNPNQYAALVDFQFNTGGLPGSTLLKLVNAMDWDRVPAELARWCHITIDGKLQVCRGLVLRRAAEGQLFLQPVSSPVIPPVPDHVASLPAVHAADLQPEAPPQRALQTTVGKLQVGALLSGASAAGVSSLTMVQPLITQAKETQQALAGLPSWLVLVVGILVVGSVACSVATLVHKMRDTHP
jgi:lysozyme